MHPLTTHRPEREPHSQIIAYWKARLLPTQKLENSFPTPRSHHSSVYYKNKIFVWGGTVEDTSSTETQILSVYELESKRWKKMLTKTAVKGLELLSGQCSAIISNRWYIFGGSAVDGFYSTQLWKLHLEKGEWVKCQQKGEPPSPTEGGHLIPIDNNWMLHYEGFNSYAPENEHYFHLYSIDAKSWFRCQGNYKYSLKFRLGTGLCRHNGQVFLFGGAYQSGEELEYLSDLHEVRVAIPSKQGKAKVQVRTISENTPVPARAGHSLFSVGKDCMVLLGGRSNEKIFNDLWAYSFKNEAWSQVKNFIFTGLERIGYSCVLADALYLFGGLVEMGGRRKLMNDLWGVQVQWQQLNRPDDIDQTQVSYTNGCTLCFEKCNNFFFWSQPFSSQTTKEYKQIIEFPFAAFGLLLDNAVMLGATDITINIDVESNGSNVIKVEDNGKEFWEENEILPNLSAFCSQDNSILIGCDKKIKKNIQRSNQVKEYGINLKLGCLCLGKRFLLVNFNSDILRVFLYSEDALHEDSEDRQYLMWYFARNERTKELLDPAMRSSQDFIETEYRKHIRDVVTHKSSNNTVYIFDTVLDDEEKLLHCREDLADILLGKPDEIEVLTRRGYQIGDSVDISLRAYLSALYLKNDTINIFIGFKGKISNINLQYLLEQIDRINKGGYCIELEGMVDFEFKFAEFYYLRDNRPEYKFFSNGILLYDKNRLVCRYRPPLGEMVPYLLQQPVNPTFVHSLNSLSFFGFAEIPQNVPLNGPKTAFAFTIMLEKMFSRMKFVEQSFRERSNKFLSITRLPFPKPKINDPSQEYIFKPRKRYQENEPKKQRVFERVEEKLPHKYSRKVKKRLTEIGDFVPDYPIMQIKQSRGDLIVKTRNQEAVLQSEPNPQVLIQHDDSSIQEIRKQ